MREIRKYSEEEYQVILTNSEYEQLKPQDD